MRMLIIFNLKSALFAKKKIQKTKNKKRLKWNTTNNESIPKIYAKYYLTIFRWLLLVIKQLNVNDEII